MQSLLDLRRRIDGGTLTAEAAVRLSRESIEAREGEIGAFTHLADASVRAGPDGPLGGIAVGIKDIIDTADEPTQLGSSLYAGWRPKADAPVVAALRRAGATIAGKTTTTPFAFLDPTQTRNPRNPAHTPGGSSAGSAAAVGAGMVPLALGTQTGGSVIRPASYCGTAAIKPSFRLLPTVGVKCFSWTLDTVGLFAATVPDLAYALAAMTGRDEIRLPEGSPPAPRIGVVVQAFAGDPEPDSAAALEHAIQRLEASGASIRHLELDPILAEAWRLHPTLQDYEARQALAWEYENHREALTPLLRDNLDAARALTAEAYDASRKVANGARKALKDAFAGVDAILTYSAPGAAPETLNSTGSARFNRLWTLMGVPCANVPGFRSSAGLPVGVQVIARFGRDDVCLQAASYVETSLRDS